MASAAPPGKKPTLCRYFMSSGSCGYGEDCQFLHQNPMSFQQQIPNFPNSFASGPNQQNGPVSGPENQGMPDSGNNGDQFFNATFSDGSVPEFQPFSRQRQPARNPRPMGSNGNMIQQNSSVPQSNSPMSQGSSMPFSSMPPKGPAMSHNNPVSQQNVHIPTNTLPPGPPPSSNAIPNPQNPHMTGGNPSVPHNLPPPPPGPNPLSQPLGPISQNNSVSQNGPISIGINGPLPPSMKQGMAMNGGFGDNLTSDFSALNLSIPSSTKGPNPLVNEFIPKLSHSSSSPNFSNFNGVHPPNTTAGNNLLAGINLTSSASPNHSPGLSPTNSPLMMRRMGSPVAPLRSGGGSGGSGKPPPGSTIQENVRGTTYFYNAEDFTPQREGVMLPNFSMYQGQPPHIAHMKIKSNMPQFFMPDELKMEVLNRNALAMAQIDLSQNSDIPEEVDNYHNLFPLEPPPDNPMQKSKTFGYPTTTYKAVNTKDGLVYCLRRIHGFRLVNTKCMSLVDMWKKMYHPNIVQLREVFTTKAFGDHSIVFVYDFFPMAETLLARHFSQLPPQMNGFNNPFTMDSSARPFSAGKGANAPRQHAGLLPESLIWAYVVQLSSALRAIHAAGLSCRTLDPSKIIIYSKSRLRLNCCGIFDVLTYDSNNPLALTQHYQQEDLVSLGKVVLALACNNVMAIQRENLQTSMELVARSYSADLKNLIMYLLGNQSRPRSINDIMPMIGARFYTQLDSAQLRSDVVEAELAKEAENGRLFRIICKLGVINERPEFNLDPQWSETGDRYMLKLFRDYLFHQVDETGAPWLDMSHVVQSMNKLDAGSPEKISLMSRDEQNVLVVSYSELKQCLDNAFNEIQNSGHSGLT